MIQAGHGARNLIIGPNSPFSFEGIVELQWARFVAGILLDIVLDRQKVGLCVVFA